MVKENIKIPQRLRVGIQKDTNRAAICCFDEFGNLSTGTRQPKEIWNWAYDTPFDCDNTPREGFSIYSGDRDPHFISNIDHYGFNQYIRDPRGFLVDIEAYNLLYLLNNMPCINGVFQGKIVYGFRNTGRGLTDKVLIPVSAPDYPIFEQIREDKSVPDHITAKKLIVGAAYELNNGETSVYMGQMPKYVGEKPDGTGLIQEGTVYMFVSPFPDEKTAEEPTWFRERYWKNIGKHVVKCVDANRHRWYDQCLESLQNNNRWSPIDPGKDKLVRYTLGEFRCICEKLKEGTREYSGYYMYSGWNADIPEKRKEAYNVRYEKDSDMWSLWEFREDGYRHTLEKVNITDNVDEIFKDIAPAYIKQYRVNGRYAKSGMYWLDDFSGAKTA